MSNPVVLKIKTETKVERSWLKSDLWHPKYSVLCLKLKLPRRHRHLLSKTWTNVYIFLRSTTYFTSFPYFRVPKNNKNSSIPTFGLNCLKMFCFILFRILLKWRIEDINNIGGISPWKRKKERKKTFLPTRLPFIPQLRITYYIFRVHILCVGSVSSNYSDTSQVLPFCGIIWPETNETKSRNISWCLAQRCWYNTSKYSSNPQCRGIFFEL